jgi:phage terminase small subunit
MGTSLIRPRDRGTKKLDDLTAQQRMFVEAMLADESFNATSAARKAKYSNPSQAGTKLIKHPIIAAALGKALQGRVHEYRLEAGQVLKHLAAALFLDPLDLFECTASGVYKVKSLEQVPVAVRRCITKMKVKCTEDKEGNVYTYMEIELMSKDSAMTNALKHLGLMEGDGPKVNVEIGQDLLSGLLDAVEADRKVINDGVLEAMATNVQVSKDDTD